MRPLRSDFPGAVHHVMSRGNGKQNIFACDHDRTDFLSLLSTTSEECLWNCYSYCLMDNHFHLLVQTPEGRLAEGMQFLNSVYSEGFNRTHDRVGHVMQGRYKSPLVKNDEHFLTVLRYMALNPVSGGLVENPADWRWSSYRALAGLCASPSFLKTGLTLGFFSSDLGKAIDEYIAFIQLGLPQAKSGELDPRPSLKCLLGAFDEDSKNKAVIEAHFEYGYSMTEIAQFLGVNCSTVSRRINQTPGTA